MQIDVNPLVWVEIRDGYRKAYGLGCEYYLSPSDGDDWIAKHYAHHAAQVRSQVAGVRLSDDEAHAVWEAGWDAHYSLKNECPAVQAAIAAMGVDAIDPAHADVL